MRNLYVVKDGLKDKGFISRNGEQVKNTNFYLLTYGKNNEGYIERKSPDNWLLYTQIGEIETIRKMNNEGIKDKSNARYHYFPTFEECIEKLKKLCGSSLVVICNSDTFPSLISV